MEENVTAAPHRWVRRVHYMWSCRCLSVANGDVSLARKADGKLLIGRFDAHNVDPACGSLMSSLVASTKTVAVRRAVSSVSVVTTSIVLIALSGLPNMNLMMNSARDWEQLQRSDTNVSASVGT